MRPSHWPVREIEGSLSLLLEVREEGYQSSRGGVAVNLSLNPVVRGKRDFESHPSCLPQQSEVVQMAYIGKKA